MQVGWLARIAVAATLACGTLVLASLPGSAQQPSASAITTARELLIAKGGDVLFIPIVNGVVQTVKNVFLPTNPGLSAELDEVAAKLQKELEPRRVELLTEVARVYAERFSEPELKALLAFYKSPLGRKMAMEEPKIVDESLSRAQTWGDALSGEVMAKFRVEMRKKGHDL